MRAPLCTLLVAAAEHISGVQKPETYVKIRNGEANFPPFLTPRNPRATCRVAPTFPRSCRCRCGGGHHTLHTRRTFASCGSAILGGEAVRRSWAQSATTHHMRPTGSPLQRNHRGRPSAERVGSGKFGRRGHASPPRDRWPRGEIVPRPTRARRGLFSRCIVVLCWAARHAPNLQTKRVLPGDKVAGCPQPCTRPTGITRETCSAGAGGCAKPRRRNTRIRHNASG